jgi:hypothetical protein
MADVRQIKRGLVFLDEWHVGVSVDRRFSEAEVEEFRRQVTMELALWALGLAGRLGVPTSRLRVDVEQ